MSVSMPRRRSQILFLLVYAPFLRGVRLFLRSVRFYRRLLDDWCKYYLISFRHLSLRRQRDLRVVLRRGTPMSSSDEKSSHRGEDLEHKRGEDLEHKRYAPRWVREQRPMAQQQQPFVDSASMVPTPSRPHQDWPPISDFNSGPQSVPEPPVRLEEGSSALVGRIALFVTFAATVALLIIFAKPLSQLATGLFEAYSGSGQTSRTNRLAATTVVPEHPSPSADRTPAPVNRMAVAAAGNVPVAQPQQ